MTEYCKQCGTCDRYKNGQCRECGKSAKARSYKKLQRHAPIKAIEIRLEDKSVFIPFSGCQIWIGPSVPRGYGVISKNGRQTYTHRVAWELVNGPIPFGMQVLHDCDVPSCINPDHLHIGTHKDNMREKSERDKCNSPVGELNGLAKLTQSQVEYIRKVYVPYDKHFSCKPLAMQLGVSSSSVYAAAKKITWRSI